MLPQTPQWLMHAERRFGFLAVPNLAIFLVAIQAIGYVMLWLKAGSDPYAADLLVERLVLIPEAVIQGEVWRLITFIAIPLSMNFFMVLILWFLYFILSSLAQAWGDFKLTLYVLIAWLGTIVASMVTGISTDSFILMETSFFFALATLAPNNEVYLFFVIPVKIKWVAIITAILMFAWPLLLGSLADKIFLVVASLNYILFFGPYFWNMMRQKVR